MVALTQIFEEIVNSRMILSHDDVKNMKIV